MELFILCFLFFITFYYLFTRSIITTKNGNLNLPPGSSGWPLIGEILDYLQTAKKGVPEKFISNRIDKYSSKIFRTSLLAESTVLLCSPEGNKFLFSNENTLVKSWWPMSMDKIFANSENTTTSEESTRMRKVLSTFLKPDSLQKYIGIMDTVTKQHLNRYWNHQQVVKVHTLMNNYTFTLSCRLFLNIEDHEMVAKLQEQIRHISSGFISLPINLPGTKLNRAIRASKQMRKEIESMVVKKRIDLLEKKVPPTKDILSHLLMETYQDGQLMKESDIANKIYGLLLGAYDTISTTLVSIMSFLAELPDVYDGVLREQMEIAATKSPGELLNWMDIQKMRYSWNVVCEVLRLLPPVLGTFREAITDFTYEGFLIQKGFKLHWNAAATHRNSKYFSDPEKFDPSRFEGKGPVPFSYVPFGGGPRMCPGKEFARMEILVFMHNVVVNFKWDKVFPDEKIIWDPILLPTKGLPIRLYPHTS